ncbi:xylulokinase [Siculibacillus lacustris]|uniref:Xylulose kinase n=1 Tax=Siculibacillus lacustris TaxID=1549641 RepID=A0A4V2KUB2_9HYPH|nr:xylulokinase [Siculibacillus lacustris]TBW40788.1 xylulokinase [Siculibacillus lacustris]
MFLGLDIGTSSVKAVLVDGNDRLIAAAERPLVVSRPHPGWSEQDPEAWWTATVGAVDGLAETHAAELAAVTGIGLSGQMHGATLLDAAGAVLRPCILWNDGRSGAECRELEAAFPELHAITGNLAMPGFTAPKLMWVARHEPEIFARVAKVLLPKAYVRFRLTGEMAEDMSDASGTLWLDPAARDWSDAALAATGLTREHMPRLVEGSDVSGTLSGELAKRWGMTTAPVVAGGAGDNAATAVGLGAISPGDSFLSLGTSGVLWVTTDRFAPNPGSAVHAFAHCIPNTWHQMGVMLSAAASLAWWAGVTGRKEGELMAELGETPRGASSVMFLPYLSGERTPANDPNLRAVFAGMGAETDRATLTRAVLEGVAHAVRDNRDALAAAGSSVAEIDIVGGGSRSRLWAQMMADMLEIPVHRVEEGAVGAAHGAARLGRLAATGEAPTAVCRRARRLESFQPDAARAASFSESHARWRHLAPFAKEISR